MIVGRAIAFQFTRPREARLFFGCGRDAVRRFQFTRPREARPQLEVVKERRNSFNSRARERRDNEVYATHALHGVSIHAPARGATVDTAGNALATRFQFTRPREARLWRGCGRCADDEFQFTRPREARLIMGKLSRAFKVSIHAPARGATNTTSLNTYIREFQFTRPREARPSVTPGTVVGT